MGAHHITTSRGSRSARHSIGSLIALMIVATTLVGITSLTVASAAFANTTKYELYCPGTPLGNLAINGVVTTGNMIPATPTLGQGFKITNYQTKLRFSSAIVSGFAALGFTALTGHAKTTVRAIGATPTSSAWGPFDYNVPIPTTIPPPSLVISLPNSPTQIWPWHATASKITIKEAPRLALTLVVSGSPLAMYCMAYPNNAVPTGIGHTPPGSPISPVIVRG